ncbi:ABC transporter permease (plasmid) [Rhizobium beringeri]|uniref:ABC transporter permease n=1 Tax=Rhizobium beringeri TaxID=3019934 RepID=UPI002E1191F5|nr:ABC transporter permease [Rhizobium beringeri]
MTTIRRGSVPRQIIAETLCDLRSLRARAILAVIGVAIGTAAVIAMLHVGHNARAEALRQFETLGADLVSITPVAASRTQTIPLDAVRDLPDAHIGVREAAAIIQGGMQLRQGQNTIPVNVLAVTDGFYELAKGRLKEGRFTSDLDRFAAYAVVGTDVAAAVEASAGKTLIPGDSIIASPQILTVVGLLQSTEPNMILGVELNSAIVVPFLAARRMVSSPTITNVVARLSSGADDIQTADAVKRYFDKHMRGGTVSVQTARQIIRSLESQMRIYAILLLAIGMISLVVGGVGVMNVILMSVMERRQEIGLRQALGARRKDICLMFLTEALALSLIGSLLGIAIGYLAGWIFAIGSGWHFQPASSAIPLGLGMAIIVGLFFGIYPASRAARLEPIVALRAE